VDKFRSSDTFRLSILDVTFIMKKIAVLVIALVLAASAGDGDEGFLKNAERFKDVLMKARIGGPGKYYDRGGLGDFAEIFARGDSDGEDEVEGWKKDLYVERGNREDIH